MVSVGTGLPLGPGLSLGAGDTRSCSPREAAFALAASTRVASLAAAGSEYFVAGRRVGVDRRFIELLQGRDRLFAGQRSLSERVIMASTRQNAGATDCPCRLRRS